MAESLVFITGATGFIGSHVVDVTLKAGYRVRLSVRKPEQAKKILERHSEYASKIETVVIPDFTVKESLNAALGNVDFIFHLASPMPGSGSDVRKDYVVPAVQGTETILYAALDFPQIQKIVLMSSALALAPVDALFTPTLSLKDNTGEVIPVDLDRSFPEGAVGHGLRYAASKIYAHQATREFVRTNAPKYTLATFHPVFVLGDSLIQESAEKIDGVNGMFWGSLFSEKPMIPSGCWVHVRDVADAHVKALTASIESGKEFLLCGPALSWEEAVEFVKERYPSLGCKLQPPFNGAWEVDVTAANQILGQTWRSQKTVISDVIGQQLALGEKTSQA